MEEMNKTIGAEVPAEAPAEPAPATAAEEELQELPETSITERMSRSSLIVQAMLNKSWQTAEEAAGGYAQMFLEEHFRGKKMILRESARKKVLLFVILAVITFLALSLRMLYHRNKFLFFLIYAACAVLAWMYVFRDNSRKTLARKLATMPDADMEDVLMSEADSMVSRKKVSVICGVIGAVLLVAFVALFWQPHMIFEKTDGVVSLRFYSDSFRREADVVIPDTWEGEPVEQIRGNVFENANWIRTVRLPDRLTTIRAHAFMGCKNLQSVEFPSTLRSIGSSAFRDCPNLKSVVLPQGCSVNEKAFKNSGTKIEYMSGK